MYSGFIMWATHIVYRVFTPPLPVLNSDWQWYGNSQCNVNSPTGWAALSVMTAAWNGHHLETFKGLPCTSHNIWTPLRWSLGERNMSLILKRSNVLIPLVFPSENMVSCILGKDCLDIFTLLNIILRLAWFCTWLGLTVALPWIG